MRRVGKYAVGRTIGGGTFAKVKFAINTDTGGFVALKVLAKDTVLRNKMVEQIKREVSIMKMVRHPNVVRLHEVLASRVKIYIVLEFVSGGELFDEIVHQGKLSEEKSRRYFQQLIDAVDYCHSRGVSHRDLKPENLLLDAQGNLKISDFGLSALPLQVREDGLLHTVCGTPNYVAPEVLENKGYDGAVADIWSCGVILFVLMSGYLPFNEADLKTLYNKVGWFTTLNFENDLIVEHSFSMLEFFDHFDDDVLLLHDCQIQRGRFFCPAWFSPDAKSLISKILDPNPRTRIRVEGIRNHSWFKENYVPVRVNGAEETPDFGDVESVFDNSEENFVDEEAVKDSGPSMMNAFELITLSQGLNLSALFDRPPGLVKRQAFVTSNRVPKGRISRMDSGPSMMNAFELITLSQGLNLSALFDRRQDYVKRQTRFVSDKPAKEIISKMESTAQSMGFRVETHKYKMRLEGRGVGMIARCLAVAIEVFEMAPSLFMIEVRKAMGDTLDYHKFYKTFCGRLKDITCKIALGIEAQNKLLPVA